MDEVEGYGWIWISRVLRVLRVVRGIWGEVFRGEGREGYNWEEID